jgi:hypothetical protein
MDKAQNKNQLATGESQDEPVKGNKIAKRQLDRQETL